MRRKQHKKEATPSSANISIHHLQKCIPTHLGAVTRSNVKMTTGAFWPGAIGRPVRTTVSPLRTDLTVARPRLGSTGRIAAVGTGSDMVVWLAVVSIRICIFKFSFVFAAGS